MRHIRTAIVCIAIATLALAQEGVPPSLDVVLDLERPSETDVLFLRNGDQLTGTILNESFNIRTSYAQLSLSNRVVAGIDLEGGANNIESIITVNDNRFSGFIDDPFFAFRLQGGPVIEIRREKVLKAVFRLREQEREGIPQRQFVTMKNGDYFSGRLMNTNIVAATTYADVPLDLAGIESITFIGEANPLTRILYHNGDALQGILNQEDMRFVLDVGGEVEIYQDRIDSVFLREGFVPNPNVVHGTAAQPLDAVEPGPETAPGTGTASSVEIFVFGDPFGIEEMRKALLHAVDWESVLPNATLWFQQFEDSPRVVADFPYNPELAQLYFDSSGVEEGWRMKFATGSSARSDVVNALEAVRPYLEAVGIRPAGRLIYDFSDSPAFSTQSRIEHVGESYAPIMIVIR